MRDATTSQQLRRPPRHARRFDVSWRGTIHLALPDQLRVPCGMPSRRQFLKVPAIGLLGAAANRVALAQPAGGTPQAPPGQPPAFGTGPAVGPTISPTTIAEAEKLM